jgi:hypothetical protein
MAAVARLPGVASRQRWNILSCRKRTSRPDISRSVQVSSGPFNQQLEADIYLVQGSKAVKCMPHRGNERHCRFNQTKSTAEFVEIPIWRYRVHPAASLSRYGQCRRSTGEIQQNFRNLPVRARSLASLFLRTNRMRSNMSTDEHTRRAARQELLEFASCVMAGSPCAPMPGTLFEMLEIAAVERRMTSSLGEGGSNLFDPLTSERIETPITQRLLKLIRPALDVARKSRERSGTWQLPA